MKQKIIKQMAVFFTLYAAALLIALYTGAFEAKVGGLEKKEFEKKAEIETETAVIGTNITEHQIIHGEGGSIWYRYKLETDCPHWDYEDRYETAKELDFIGEHAAVETNATSIKVLLNGVSYAEAQYFEVPLLGLKTNDQDLEEYEKGIVSLAYQQYKTDETEGNMSLFFIFVCVLVMTPVLIFVQNWILQRKHHGTESDIAVQLTAIRMPDNPKVHLVYVFFQKDIALVKILAERCQREYMSCDINGNEKMESTFQTELNNALDERNLKYAFVGKLYDESMGATMAHTLVPDVVKL